MAKHTEHTSQNKSYMLANDLGKNMLEVKTLFYMSERHAGYQPGLSRGPTPPRRGVVPTASFKSKVGKPGFPFEEHEEHEHEGHEEYEY